MGQEYCGIQGVEVGDGVSVRVEVGIAVAVDVLVCVAVSVGVHVVDRLTPAVAVGTKKVRVARSITLPPPVVGTAGDEETSKAAPTIIKFIRLATIRIA